MPTKKNPALENPKEAQKANSNTASPPAPTSKFPAAVEASTTHKSGVTRIKVRYNSGFGNNLFIRGKGANLSWDKGLPLKNLKHDEWVWETTVPFSQCEFKVLINDVHYEQGNNHHLQSGDTSEYTPRF